VDVYPCAHKWVFPVCRQSRQPAKRSPERRKRRSSTPPRYSLAVSIFTANTLSWQSIHFLTLVKSRIASFREVLTTFHIHKRSVGRTQLDEEGVELWVGTVYILINSHGHPRPPPPPPGPGAAAPVQSFNSLSKPGKTLMCTGLNSRSHRCNNVSFCRRESRDRRRDGGERGRRARSPAKGRGRGGSPGRSPGSDRSRGRRRAGGRSQDPPKRRSSLGRRPGAVDDRAKRARVYTIFASYPPNPLPLGCDPNGTLLTGVSNAKYMHCKAVPPFQRAILPLSSAYVRLSEHVNVEPHYSICHQYDLRKKVSRHKFSMP